jgi:hypothetical protein
MGVLSAPAPPERSLERLQQAGKVLDAVDDVIGVSAEVVARAVAGQHADGECRPGGPRHDEVVQIVAHHRHLAGLDRRFGAEGDDHVGGGLWPGHRIIAEDGDQQVGHAEPLHGGKGGAGDVVGGHPESQARLPQTPEEPAPDR